ncbi:helix-turn-helix domain-containing protein [Reyranella soli]|uniref:HTH crp-type domain-containing protein n=1 Tax=Reyranella soli TaxID=1230389 RepID=A0A512NRS8_9HYPH|nr:helix-turn-helix domain-containing protein [Reyranella soli]GEP61649.1 hypothetical protein RSO01_88150 [Reyranella soli]
MPACSRPAYSAKDCSTLADSQRFSAAHLLCEQLARREAVGINSATIPLTQMDLADAAGLSIVHINRTFQELRRLNILSKGRTINVVDRERLADLASFDGNYLNMPQLLSHWQVKIESAQSQPKHDLLCVIRPLLRLGLHNAPKRVRE